MGGITAQVELSGFDKFDQALKALQEKALHMLAAALYQEAERIMTHAKELIPVYMGTLKNSGFVDPPVPEGEWLVIRMHFGGAADQYAAVIHEGRTPGAKMPPSGVMVPWMKYKGLDEKLEFVIRRAIGKKGIKAHKYLEVPTLAAIDGMAERLAEYMRVSLSGI